MSKDDGFQLKNYAKRRFKRIYPVYLFALLVSCVVCLASGTSISAVDFIIHAVLLQGFSAEYFNTINLVLWTISVEVLFYVIYPLWQKLRLSWGLQRAFAVGLTASALSALVTALFFHPYKFPGKWFFMTTWAGWLAGAVLAETIENKKYFFSTVRWHLLGVMFLGIYVFMEMNMPAGNKWLILRIPVLTFLMVWPLAFLVLHETQLAIFMSKYRRFAAISSAIGMSSYSLYLLHEPLIQTRNLLLAQFDAGVFKLPLQLAWFFVVLWLCWLSFRFVELKFMSTKTVLNRAALPDAVNP